MDAAVKGRKAPADVGMQTLEAAKVAAAADSGTMSSLLMPVTGGPDGAAEAGRRWDVAGAVVRAATVVSSLLALALMVSAEQRGELSLFGFQLPLYSKWSFSDSLEYLVGMSAVVAAYSLLHLLLTMRKLVTKAPVILSRRHAWVIFAGDQAFAYAMMSAGSAAAGVTKLNCTRIWHATLPNFCKFLHWFYDHMAISITFAFISCLLLAISAILPAVSFDNDGVLG